MKEIRVLVVDDTKETRDNVRRLLQFGEGVLVVGEGENGEDGLAKAKELRPDVILMDINMPVMDGIAATERISVEVPETVIIMMSVQGEQEYLRKAMTAGAREYLIKPFSGDDLVNTIRRVHEMEDKRRGHRVSEPERAAAAQGKVITVFSAKGGVGKTTIACNLAVTLAQESGSKVALVDLDLQFGDVAVFMDVSPKRTIAELAQEKSLDADLVESYLVQHPSGVRVLPCPSRPEHAEMVTTAHIESIVQILRTLVDYVVIDTPQAFSEAVLGALDFSDLILVISTLEIPTVKNVKLSLEVMQNLNYPEDKIILVLNRYSDEIGIPSAELVKSLRVPVGTRIPSDGRTVVSSVNKGVPFVITDPRSKIAEAVRELARGIIGKSSPEEARKKPGFSLRNVFGQRGK